MFRNMTTRTEYRITGIFRMDLKDQKRHAVDFNRNWTLADAKRKLREIQHNAEWEMEHRQCKQTGVATTLYLSDYDLLDLRIESREVTKWQVLVKSEVTSDE